MTKKVHELAKELNVSSKELQEKAGQLGISVSSHMSVLSDADIVKIKGAKTETKIVKAEAKKKDHPEQEEPRVTVKAAVRPGLPNRPKPPMGKPVVDTEYLANKHKPPVGKPVVNKEELENRSKKSEETEAPSVKAEAAAPVEKQPEKEIAKPAPRTAEKSAGDKSANDSKTHEGSSRNSEHRSDHNDNRSHGDRNNNNRGSYGDRSSNNRGGSGDRSSNNRGSYGDRNNNNRGGSGDRNNNNRSGGGYNNNRPSGNGDRNNRPGGGSGDRNNNNRSGGGYNNNRPSGSGDRNNRPGGGSGDRSSNNRGSYGDRNNNNRGGSNDRNNNNRSGGGYNNNRPSGSGDRNNNRPGSQRKDRPQGEKMEVKPSIAKRDDSKKKPDKERNKFAKLERRSLEKQARKKHVKQKPVVVEPTIEEEALPEGTIVLNVPITVAGFCEQTEVSTSKVIMTLMKLGIMANINQNVDEDTVMVLAEDLGLSVVVGKVEEKQEEEGLELFEDEEGDLKSRPPIITVMGHVDHGKTSLLDAIRKTNVTASESGGITQHIGASEVKINGQKIVFLDTPGHEAFTAMRARGAHVTDMAVLVVAADDSVKPQTIESISHAKAAGVPIIVAINKMDKPGANPDKVKQDLTEHGILVEDWGGDVISVPVSAKSGDGIVNLLEMILLQAEVMELKANPNRLAMGSVIEARLDKSKGPVASLLVTNGTLHSGQSIVAGTCSGRIRLMTDFKGRTIKKAGPATAVEILGLTDVPQAGDEFNAVKEDKMAREIAEHRKEKLREEVLARNASSTLEQLFSQIQAGEVKELNLIIKGDVQGSVGALVASLEKLNNENVKVNIIHTGVGTVTESDVMLAGTSGAIIIGFNVRPSTAVQTMADRDNIQIRTYRVIYDVIDDVENAMKGMLDPEFKEEILGKVEIRSTFKVPGVGIVGGAYVQEGKVVRNAEIRLVRDGIVIHEGKISSLKRFKDDAKEVATGYECGIGIEAYNDIKEGDIIECFHMVEIERN
ncbi:translation initiation factor IF-2 [Emergencia timonensis]|uniref:translation initiation factor IF-2 n=1 Tax=Emergencia timonensis TaxID=1776384 RepID=UPI000836EBC7|nr:translation initiation factor IF-2 [Emergencia timonensis]WNX90374.1 translation initiation factor IF-2 [Emergencia timonensis]